MRDTRDTTGSFSIATWQGARRQEVHPGSAAGRLRPTILRSRRALLQAPLISFQARRGTRTRPALGNSASTIFSSTVSCAAGGKSIWLGSWRVSTERHLE